MHTVKGKCILREGGWGNIGWIFQNLFSCFSALSSFVSDLYSYILISLYLYLFFGTWEGGCNWRIKLPRPNITILSSLIYYNAYSSVESKRLGEACLEINTVTYFLIDLYTQLTDFTEWFAHISKKHFTNW